MAADVEPVSIVGCCSICVGAACKLRVVHDGIRRSTPRPSDAGYSHLRRVNASRHRSGCTHCFPKANSSRTGSSGAVRVCICRACNSGHAISSRRYRYGHCMRALARRGWDTKVDRTIVIRRRLLTCVVTRQVPNGAAGVQFPVTPFTCPDPNHGAKRRGNSVLRLLASPEEVAG